MGVIKKAFTEGRETDTEWSKSESKKNQLKLDLFLHNVNNFNGKEYGKAYHVQRIDPKNGKVLDHFNSRFAAAKWVCEHLLKISPDDEKFDKKALSITGNMHMCMTNGWKAYGFYWKYMDSEDFISELKSSASVPVNAKSVYVKANGVSNWMVYPSIIDAAEATGIGEKRIRTALKGRIGGRIEDFTFQYMNPEARTIEFKTLNDGVRETGITEATLRRIIAEETVVNNYTYKINNFKKVIRYAIMHGDTVVKKFTSLRKMARELQMNDTTCKEILNRNLKVNGIYRLAVKEEIVSTRKRATKKRKGA